MNGIKLDEQEYEKLIKLLRYMRGDLMFYEAEANRRKPKESSPMTVSLIKESGETILKLQAKKD